MKIFNTEKEWQDILEQSKSGAVFILKHSNTCPISAKGYAEVEKFSKEKPKALVFVLIVQDAPDLKQQIAKETSVVHESPQVLLLLDNKVVYNTSHYNINAKELILEYDKVL